MENLKELFRLSQNKLPLTIIYCMVFWNFGICVAIFGPTLLDLACQTSSSMSAVSWLYFVQNLTTLLGCLVSGFILKQKKLASNNLLIICTLMLPFCVALMAEARHIAFLGLLMALLGFNMGCIDNVGNLSILKLYGNNVSPFIQCLHFFYGFGAFITPIVVEMFLSSRRVDSAIYDSTSALNCDNSNSDKITHDLVHGTHKMESKTKYAFWILALIQLPVPLVLFIFRFLNFTPSENELHEELIDEQNACGTLSERITHWFKEIFANENLYMLKLTCLLSILVFLFDGLQATHSGYIFAYAVRKYDFPSVQSNLSIIHHHKIHRQSDEAYITASFWAFFSLGRLAAIFIATKFTPAFMITCDLIGIFLATLLLLLTNIINMQSKFFLYVSTCAFGLALSNTTPSCYSLAEIFIGMTPSSTSFVIISAALGEILLPIIVGTLFDEHGPGSLIIVEIVSISVGCLVFFLFWNQCKLNTRYTQIDHQSGIASFIWLKKQSDKDVEQLKDDFYEFDESYVDNEHANFVKNNSTSKYNAGTFSEL